jgi:hypothetical protein
MTVENQPVEKKDVQTTVISSCAATTCRYNTNQQCTAGTVMLVMKDEMPACGTFAPRS